ncbi:MAG: phytanoyl-CoA dioxygenase family protein [Legionella sp.]
MSSYKDQLLHQGYCLIPNLCTPQTISQVKPGLFQAIDHCALALSCDTSNYLRNVSRWVHPSPITHQAYTLIPSLQQKVNAVMGQPMTLQKTNIISKSIYANAAVPCHQDLAYSPQNPYQLSLWLALDTVKPEDGALSFWAGSHLHAIEAAIDFWQPDFQDLISQSPGWLNGQVSVAVNAGDGILFDSRIWHKSEPNTSGNNRFALVTRWSHEAYTPPHIPDRVMSAFGMWTCGQKTHDLLQAGLKQYFNLNGSKDFIGCILQWQELLPTAKLPFQLDIPRALDALEGVRILHLAAEQHNGGDSQGRVYANLWHALLAPLECWVKLTPATLNHA